MILNREPNETFGKLVCREINSVCYLGVSIVGGRVEVSQKGGLPGTGNTVTGIFIKSVMLESPAGRSNKIFMGDRIISVSILFHIRSYSKFQVNDIDLRNATHEQAVQAIKNAKNPVRY